MLTRGSCFSERWRHRCDGSVISISSTPNCSLIAAATVGRSLYLFDSDGKALWCKSGDAGLDHEGWSTAISADGSTVVVGTANKNPSDGTIYIYNAHGDLLFTRNLGAPVWSVHLSADGSIIAASCWNGDAYKFARSGSQTTLVAKFSSKISTGLYGIRLTRTGEMAVVCAYNAGLIILDNSFKEIGRCAHSSGLYNVTLAEDSRLAFAGERNGGVLVCDLERRDSRLIKVAGCGRPICGVSASRRGDLLICGSFDGSIYAITETGIPLGQIETDGEVWSVACSDDAALVCVASGDHTVRLLENTCSVAPIREVTSLESTISNGGDTPCCERLVKLYARYGLFQYGYSHLKKIQESSPTSSTAFRKGSHQLLDLALKASAQNHWAHYELGKIAQEETRYQDAVYHFQQAARLPEYTAKAMNRCADAFNSLRLNTAVASCYRRAREQQIDSDAKRVLYNLGRSYEDTKLWEEAISHYELLASWDATYRNTWERLEHLRSIIGKRNNEPTPKRADYTGITISLLGPDAPRDVDNTLTGVLKARTQEVLINDGERQRISEIIDNLRSNKPYCRGITGVGLDYTQELFLKYDYALPEDETKKFLETVNLLYLLSDFKPNVTLDIGSATGRYPTLMSWFGAKAYGIDIEPRAVEYATKLKGNDEWPKYIVCDARNLTFKVPTFDLITCMMGTFAHIPAVEQPHVLNQVIRALKPGGYVAISTWDMECGHLAYLSIYNEKQKDVIRNNSPSTEEMRRMLENAGFSEIQIRPFCMLPQIIIYDLGLEELRSGDIRLAAQADLSVRSLYAGKHGEMYLAFAKKLS